MMILSFYILFALLGACNLLFVVLIWTLMKEPIVLCPNCQREMDETCSPEVKTKGRR